MLRIIELWEKRFSKYEEEIKEELIKGHYDQANKLNHKCEELLDCIGDFKRYMNMIQ